MRLRQHFAYSVLCAISTPRVGFSKNTMLFCQRHIAVLSSKRPHLAKPALSHFFDVEEAVASEIRRFQQLN